MVSSLFPSALNKSAALRILTRIVGSVVRKVEVVRRLRNTAIQVSYRIGSTLCSTFLSARLFEQDFESFRQEGAKQVTVRRWSAGSYQNHYECQSLNGERIYTVKLLAGLAMCECPDYQKQHQELGRVKLGCKHVLAVMNHLEYSSLEAYLDAKASEARASLFAF